MRRGLLKRIFPVAAFLLLIPWPVAYGYEFAGEAGSNPVQIAAAATAKQPTWTAFGNAIGSVTAGDLFYIDATDNPADVSVTLYLTNARELIGNYRYLILNVGLYRQDADGDRQRLTEYRGAPVPDMFLTMSNGRVDFTLPGAGSYALTVDDGSFYCYNAGAGGGYPSPNFYLELH
ncbi:MAG: hypothetical protein ABID87_05900 [Chloroflexota bacterium]